MSYWDGVLSRLSVPGMVALAVGALMCWEAPKLAKLVFKEGGDRAVLPLKVAGLLLALAGALILLDIIPNG